MDERPGSGVKTAGDPRIQIRWQAASDRNYAEKSDVRVRCEAPWVRAVEIFGSETKADRWFHTRPSEVADRTPEEVLEEDAHAEAVAVIIDRID